jgi:hypothetical protein
MNETSVDAIFSVILEEFSCNMLEKEFFRERTNKNVKMSRL